MENELIHIKPMWPPPRIYPTMATYWACEKLDEQPSLPQFQTKGDIRGIFGNAYIKTSIGTQFGELVGLVMDAIDWDYVYEHYRTKLCPKTNQDM